MGYEKRGETGSTFLTKRRGGLESFNESTCLAACDIIQPGLVLPNKLATLRDSLNSTCMKVTDQGDSRAPTAPSRLHRGQSFDLQSGSTFGEITLTYAISFMDGLRRRVAPGRTRRSGHAAAVFG
jgi:hypothetical protein